MMFERVGDWIRQTCCGLRGHDTMVARETGRMFLKCTSCFHESPGWDLNEPPPVPFVERVVLHLVERVV